jgi:predicted phosphate transport protein (TIGR00153 family)
MPLNIFGRLMPPTEDFTKLFCAQAGYVVEAAEELRRLVNGDDAVDRHIAAIRKIEMDADGVARAIFTSANRTFNAPIDREDIVGLAHDLDDVVDLIEDTAKGIQRYRVRTFDADMHAMADAVVESARMLAQVMPYLDSINRDYKAIFEICEKIGQTEGRADDSLDRGLLKLRADVAAGALDALGYIDRKELYELIEQVVDKCDDVANALQRVTAKHV